MPQLIEFSCGISFLQKQDPSVFFAFSNKKRIFADQKRLKR